MLEKFEIKFSFHSNSIAIDIRRYMEKRNSMFHFIFVFTLETWYGNLLGNKHTYGNKRIPYWCQDAEYDYGCRLQGELNTPLNAFTHRKKHSWKHGTHIQSTYTHTYLKPCDSLINWYTATLFLNNLKASSAH